MNICRYWSAKNQTCRFLSKVPRSCKLVCYCLIFYCNIKSIAFFYKICGYLNTSTPVLLVPILPNTCSQHSELCPHPLCSKSIQLSCHLHNDCCFQVLDVIPNA